MRAKIAIMIGAKGRGSNMLNLIEAAQTGRFDADVSVVIATHPNAPALQLAAEKGIPTLAISPKDSDYAAKLISAMDDCYLVCLAGYLNLLPVPVIEHFQGRVLNIHPALLPNFGGKGMYGLNVHKAVLDAGEEISGATVHYVSENYDEGLTLHRSSIAIDPGETPESLAAKVLQVEHEIYPEAVALVLEEREA